MAESGRKWPPKRSFGPKFFPRLSFGFWLCIAHSSSAERWCNNIRELGIRTLGASIHDIRSLFNHALLAQVLQKGGAATRELGIHAVGTCILGWSPHWGPWAPLVEFEKRCRTKVSQDARSLPLGGGPLEESEDHCKGRGSHRKQEASPLVAFPLWGRGGLPTVGQEWSRLKSAAEAEGLTVSMREKEATPPWRRGVPLLGRGWFPHWGSGEPLVEVEEYCRGQGSHRKQEASHLF